MKLKTEYIENLIGLAVVAVVIVFGITVIRGDIKIAKINNQLKQEALIQIEVELLAYKNGQLPIGKLDDGTVINFKLPKDLYPKPRIGDRLTIEFDKGKLIEIQVEQGTFETTVADPE